MANLSKSMSRALAKFAETQVIEVHTRDGRAFFKSDNTTCGMSTLIGLSRRGLVERYHYQAGYAKWRITEAGRQALARAERCAPPADPAQGRQGEEA